MTESGSGFFNFLPAHNICCPCNSLSTKHLSTIFVKNICYIFVKSVKYLLKSGSGFFNFFPAHNICCPCCNPLSTKHLSSIFVKLKVFYFSSLWYICYVKRIMSCVKIFTGVTITMNPKYMMIFTSL